MEKKNALSLYKEKWSEHHKDIQQKLLNGNSNMNQLDYCESKNFALQWLGKNNLGRISCVCHTMARKRISKIIK